MNSISAIFAAPFPVPVSIRLSWSKKFSIGSVLKTAMLALIAIWCGVYVGFEAEAPKLHNPMKCELFAHFEHTEAVRLPEVPFLASPLDDLCITGNCSKSSFSMRSILLMNAGGTCLGTIVKVSHPMSLEVLTANQCFSSEAFLVNPDPRGIGFGYGKCTRIGSSSYPDLLLLKCTVSKNKWKEYKFGKIRDAKLISAADYLTMTAPQRGFSDVYLSGVSKVRRENMLVDNPWATRLSAYKNENISWRKINPFFFADSGWLRISGRIDYFSADYVFTFVPAWRGTSGSGLFTDDGHLLAVLHGFCGTIGVLGPHRVVYSKITAEMVEELRKDTVNIGWVDFLSYWGDVRFCSWSSLGTTILLVIVITAAVQERLDNAMLATGAVFGVLAISIAFFISTPPDVNITVFTRP